MQHVSRPRIPRLQRALQEFDENFDVIGLINFNWDHTVIRSPSHLLAGRKTPEHCAGISRAMPIVSLSLSFKVSSWLPKGL